MTKPFRYVTIIAGNKNIRKQKNRVIQYELGEKVKHPKFGEGLVENIQQTDGAVKLHIRFQDETKIIDQKWLLKTKYR